MTTQSAKKTTVHITVSLEMAGYVKSAGFTHAEIYRMGYLFLRQQLEGEEREQKIKELEDKLNKAHSVIEFWKQAYHDTVEEEEEK